MEFFNDEVAYVLQFYTFPMEALGLVLATIEVRFPLVAQKITLAVNTEWEKYAETQIKEVDPPRPEADASVFKQLWFHTSGPLRWLFLWLPLCILIFVGSYGGWIQVVMPQYLLLFLPVLLVLGAIWFAVRWVKGRTVGTLGILIAGLGVCGEAYQFTNQLVL